MEIISTADVWLCLMLSTRWFICEKVKFYIRKCLSCFQKSPIPQFIENWIIAHCLFFTNRNIQNFSKQFFTFKCFQSTCWFNEARFYVHTKPLSYLQHCQELLGWYFYSLGAKIHIYEKLHLSLRVKLKELTRRPSKQYEKLSYGKTNYSQKKGKSRTMV